MDNTTNIAKELERLALETYQKLVEFQKRNGSYNSENWAKFNQENWLKRVIESARTVGIYDLDTRKNGFIRNVGGYSVEIDQKAVDAVFLLIKAEETQKRKEDKRSKETKILDARYGEGNWTQSDYDDLVE